MTAADKYYLKAKDNFDYNLEDAIESLEYGLSSDNEHAGLLMLMGRLYFEQLQQYDKAAEYFDMAIFYDSCFADAYIYAARLALHVEQYDKAKRLIQAAHAIAGADQSRLYYLEGLLHEKKQEYSQAIKCMDMALQKCSTKDCFAFYEDEAERIDRKRKRIAMRAAPVNIILR